MFVDSAHPEKVSAHGCIDAGIVHLSYPPLVSQRTCYAAKRCHLLQRWYTDMIKGKVDHVACYVATAWWSLWLGVFVLLSMNTKVC